MVSKLRAGVVGVGVGVGVPSGTKEEQFPFMDLTEGLDFNSAITQTSSVGAALVNPDCAITAATGAVTNNPTSKEPLRVLNFGCMKFTTSPPDSVKCLQNIKYRSRMLRER
jgi:hypothetical protein